MWSYGGTQSAAIAVLILRGEVPRPERIVMTDTSREVSATWAYLDEVVGPALSEVEPAVEVAPHTLATKDLYSADGKPLMPVYTRQPGESGGSGRCATSARASGSGRWCGGTFVRSATGRRDGANGGLW